MILVDKYLGLNRGANAAGKRRKCPSWPLVVYSVYTVEKLTDQIFLMVYSTYTDQI